MNAEAIEHIDAWLELPGGECLSETDEFWRVLRSFLNDARVEGPLVNDT